jgi:hypothetical protein
VNVTVAGVEGGVDAPAHLALVKDKPVDPTIAAVTAAKSARGHLFRGTCI